MTLKWQFFHVSSPPSYCKKRNNKKKKSTARKQQQQQNIRTKLPPPQQKLHSQTLRHKTSGHKKILFYLFMRLDLNVSFLPLNILKNNSNFSYIASR